MEALDRIDDETGFTNLAARYRAEIAAHCRRLLRSGEDAEDAVQDTFLRAWRSRASYRGDSSARSWLYRIATNACMDALRRRGRLATHEDGDAAVLERVPATDPEPYDSVVSRETVETTLMVAIRHLAPKERAALILRGMLDLPAKDVAGLLDGSVVSVNSALQRARRTLEAELPERSLEWTQGSEASEEERALLHRYLEAIEAADADAFVEALGGRAASTVSCEQVRDLACAGQGR